MEQEYEGWSNRETWATALHIDNDQVLLEMALEYARQEIDSRDEDEEVDLNQLGETLRSWIEDDLLTLENISGNHPLWLMLTDIGSLYRVNWREIAEVYVDSCGRRVSA